MYVVWASTNHKCWISLTIDQFTVVWPLFEIDLQTIMQWYLSRSGVEYNYGATNFCIYILREDAPPLFSWIQWASQNLRKNPYSFIARLNLVASHRNVDIENWARTQNWLENTKAKISESITNNYIFVLISTKLAVKSSTQWLIYYYHRWWLFR